MDTVKNTNNCVGDMANELTSGASKEAKKKSLRTATLTGAPRKMKP